MDLDLFFKFDEYLLLLVDSYSELLVVYNVATTVAGDTINQVRNLFIIFCLSDEII